MFRSNGSGLRYTRIIFKQFVRHSTSPDHNRKCRLQDGNGQYRKPKRAKPPHQMVSRNPKRPRIPNNFLCHRYHLDSDAQPPCYRLQPISSHIPGFKENSQEFRETALDEWRTEMDKVLNVLITVFPQELRDTYLTTVVEQVNREWHTFEHLFEQFDFRKCTTPSLWVRS